MPFHPLWIAMMLIVAVIVIGPVIALVVVFARRPLNAIGAASKAPTLSADGRWWWDGREWKPVGPPPTPPG